MTNNDVYCILQAELRCNTVISPMKIEDIEAEWAADSKLIEEDLVAETAKTVKLHAKYSKYYRIAFRNLAEAKAVRAKMLKLKTEYYAGDLNTDKDTLDKYGWEPFRKIVKLRDDQKAYIAADEDLIKLDLRIADADYATTFLEGVLTMVKNRNFHIRTCLDYMIFQNGGR